MKVKINFLIRMHEYSIKYFIVYAHIRIKNCFIYVKC